MHWIGKGKAFLHLARCYKCRWESDSILVSEHLAGGLELDIFYIHGSCSFFDRFGGLVLWVWKNALLGERLGRKDIMQGSAILP
jgi:hypothetical protein